MGDLPQLAERRGERASPYASLLAKPGRVHRVPGGPLDLWPEAPTVALTVPSPPPMALSPASLSLSQVAP